jgi:putative membrane protein
MKDDQNKVTGYLANEQTYLAWLRTGVEVMALGFVAVKFSLFASQVMGIILVGCGGLMIGLAYLRYRNTSRQLRKEQYTYSSFLVTATALAIVIISAVLLAYLIEAYLKTGNTHGNPVDEKQKSEAVSSKF